MYSPTLCGEGRNRIGRACGCFPNATELHAAMLRWENKRSRRWAAFGYSLQVQGTTAYWLFVFP
eukprot:scaffold649_cov347-Pavlova_lutheri.AAC.31